MDSDNVAVADVEPLFASPEYNEDGAVLWPDYWTSSAAPDLQAILGLHKMGGGTCESGQMVFDKSRWVVLSLSPDSNADYMCQAGAVCIGKGKEAVPDCHLSDTQTDCNHLQRWARKVITTGAVYSLV